MADDLVIQPAAAADLASQVRRRPLLPRRL
jgi:hypothetical protein